MFKKYSYIYDIINKNKDYKSEIDYLLKLVKKYQKKPCNSFLDYGCGTGKHCNILNAKVKKVLGVDKSDNMLNIARNQFPEIEFKNINLKNKKKFDVCYSLFHVFSYLTNNKQVNFFFKYISANLKRNGLLIFDYWSKDLVLLDPPQKKLKEFIFKNQKIIRKTSFQHIKKKDLIKVFFDFLIEENKKKNLFREVHEMRYYSKTSINNFLEIHNFRLIDHFNWLNKKNWYKCVVAIKK